MHKEAGIGTAIASIGAKALSNPTVRTLGSTALKAGKTAWATPVSRNAIKGGVTGMAVGALSAQPDQNGKRHIMQNALRGGLTGASIGGAMGTTQQFAPQIKNFGSQMLSTMRPNVPRQMNESNQPGA